MKKTLWLLFALSAIVIGIYPIIYFLIDPNFGLLNTKSSELLANQLWSFAFYTHITVGGLALLIGWLQFSKRLRRKYMDWHRRIGKIYVLAVLISGTCAFGIGPYASGDNLTKIGFMISALIWLFTTLRGFFHVKNQEIIAHQNMMIYSYAICFSAVTLRIWLPLLMYYYEGNFAAAYAIVAWLSWIPNLIVAYLIINKSASQTTTTA